MKNNRSLIGIGTLLAFTSSLCCILPILTILGGVGGLASSFSWVEPLRPYLIGATGLILGFAFYRAYKPQKQDECGCTPEKKKFMETKKFLWGITILSALLISFPYYSHIFLPENKQNSSYAPENVREKTFHILGMTCEACENHVNHSFQSQDGVIKVSSDYAKGKAFVTYDLTKVSIKKLALVSEKICGYKVRP
ncbi:MAG: mercuric transport protein MerTP [Bacteroidota bacterium]